MPSVAPASARSFVETVITVSQPLNVSAAFVEMVLLPVVAAPPGIDPGRQARNFWRSVPVPSARRTARVGLGPAPTPPAFVPGIDPGRQARNWQQFVVPAPLRRTARVGIGLAPTPPAPPIPSFDPGRQARQWSKFFLPPPHKAYRPNPLTPIVPSGAIFGAVVTKMLASGGSVAFGAVVRKALQSTEELGTVVFGAVVAKRLVSRLEASTLNFGAIVKKTLCLAIPALPQEPPYIYSADFGAIPIFPVLPESYPVKVSPVLDTIIGTTKSLREMRVAQQPLPIWDIELPFEELRDQTQNQAPYVPFIGYTQYEALVQTWLAMYGQSNVFAFDCPWDDSRSAQQIGIGDGSTWAFTVGRTWGLGAQAMLLPVGMVNTVTSVYVNNVLIAPANYSISRNKIYFISPLGVISPPAPGATVVMTFSFYYLCRFTEDEQTTEEFSKNRWTASVKFRAVVWV